MRRNVRSAFILEREHQRDSDDRARSDEHALKHGGVDAVIAAADRRTRTRAETLYNLKVSHGRPIAQVQDRQATSDVAACARERVGNAGAVGTSHERIGRVDNRRHLRLRGTFGVMLLRSRTISGRHKRAESQAALKKQWKRVLCVKAYIGESMQREMHLPPVGQAHIPPIQKLQTQT